MVDHRAIPSVPSPRYTPHADDVELSRLDSIAPSILSAPPPYDEAAAAGSASAFRPTVHLQIETPGKPLLSFPSPPRPDPIPIFALRPDERSSSSSAAAAAPKFVSIRPERGSGSCYLVDASDDSSPLSTTTYRFGPGRPPHVRLFHPAARTGPSSPAALRALLFPDGAPGGICHKAKGKTAYSSDNEPAAANSDPPEPWDEFAVRPLGLLTRAVAFRCRLGSFRWRYASRRERHAVAAAGELHGTRPGAGQHGAAADEDDISSMLVLERVVRVAAAQNQNQSQNGRRRHRDDDDEEEEEEREQGQGHDQEVRTVVARFIRGAGYRTPGSSASSAGNGGRLVVDLSLWGGGGGDGDGEKEGGGKGERDMALVMVVTTCLLMLKREVDRRRAQQMAVMAGIIAGGSS